MEERWCLWCRFADSATGKNVEITVFPSGKTTRLMDIYYES